MQKIERDIPDLLLLQAYIVHNLLIYSRQNCDVMRIGKGDVELGQQAGLRSVTVGDHVVTLLLFDKLEYCELFALSQHWLLVLLDIWQVSDAKVEVGPPADAERLLAVQVLGTVVHVCIANLQIGAGRGLSNAVETSRYLASWLR